MYKVPERRIELGVKTALVPEQLTVPGTADPLLRVKVAVVRELQSIPSLKATITVALVATPTDD